MKSNRWVVSNMVPQDGYVPDENWFAVLKTVSPVWDRVDTIADQMCALTNHRWCHFYGKIAMRAERDETEVLRVPISRKQAVALSPAFVTSMDEVNGD